MGVDDGDQMAHQVVQVDQEGPESIMESHIHYLRRLISGAAVPSPHTITSIHTLHLLGGITSALGGITYTTLTGYPGIPGGPL